MFTFKRLIPIGLAGVAAAAAAAAALHAGPASASAQSPTGAVSVAALRAPATAVRHGWTINPGGVVTAKASSGTVRDRTAGRDIDCRLSSMTIHLKSGRFTGGVKAGSVSAASLTGCTTMNQMLPVKVSLGALPWHVNLSHYHADTRVTTGYLSGLHLAISVPLLHCTAAADGTGPDKHNGLLAASYSNNTHVLSAVATGSHLRVYSVSHCDGLITNGDTVSLSANYKLHPGVKITHS